MCLRIRRNSSGNCRQPRACYASCVEEADGFEPSKSSGLAGLSEHEAVNECAYGSRTKSGMTQRRQFDYFSKPSCFIAACTAGLAAMRSRKAVMLARLVMSTPTRGAQLVTVKR